MQSGDSKKAKEGNTHDKETDHNDISMHNAFSARLRMRGKNRGTLEQYLTDLNRDTQETYDMMIRQYAEIEGVTEDLKRCDTMEYTRRMNSIRNRVEDFVLHDFVCA